MTKTRNALRIASLAAILLAGSCAAPINDGSGLSPDGALNHPISVMPQNESIALPFSAPDAGLMPEDAARFSAFVAAYLERGSGAISVSAPSGSEASAAIAYFGERLASLGVPRDHILVGTHDGAGDSRVQIGYVGVVAHTEPCGDWSKSLADTADNATAPNFGCAVQQNIAAMVTDPRDLVSPHPMTDADATRRQTVLDNYEKGKVTASDKTQDQSGKVSDLSTQ